MDENQEERLFKDLFSSLVLSLNEAAMTQLGKIVNPMSGKVERHLDQAKSTIDLLRMLKEKTQGNLSEGENRLLEQSLLALQMNYVYEAEQDKKAGKPAEGAPADQPDPTVGPIEPDLRKDPDSPSVN